MVKVGNVQGKKGTIQKGVLHTGSYADGTSIAIPVMIATGEQEGPVLWLEGCIHGEEYGGAASIIKYVESLDLKTFKGTLIAVPVINLPCYLGRGRVSTLDGENLNRIFPGNMTGTYSHQLAHIILESINKTSDYLLDLHSGGIGAIVPFYSIYTDDKTDASKVSKRLAKSVGVDVIWKIKGEAGLGGSITAQTTPKGIPSVTVEVGGGNVTDQHISEYTTAITNMMKAIGMLDGDIPKFEKYTIISDGKFLHNREGGLFVPECKPGAFLKKDEPIGHIINLHGEKVEEILNPLEYSYITAIRHNYVPTDSGDLIAESIAVEKEESFEE